MNDVEFFRTMVMRAVEDFSKNPGDVFLGVTACLFLQSMCDHYFESRKGNPADVSNCPDSDKFRNTLRQQDWACGQIMDIANGTKHAVLSRGPRRETPRNNPLRDLTLDVPAKAGILRCGFPISPEPHVFLDEKKEWVLYQLTDHVASTWRTKLGLSESLPQSATG